jgi:hypothetical protein
MDFAVEQPSISGQFVTYCYTFSNPKIMVKTKPKPKTKTFNSWTLEKNSFPCLGCGVKNKCGSTHL